MHEFIFNVEDNVFSLQYSNYGLALLKKSSLDQALEIVRRRVDEVGTNEPNILKRGSDRILVELPGLDDPMRIKSLLGKTANLTFRFVVQNDEPSFGSEKLSFIDGTQDDVIVSKRIILSGDNLVDAKPRMDNQTNETVVSFSLDRVGSKRFGKATTTGVGKRLAIVLDGKVISAPVVRDAIIGGSGQISGGFTFQSATDLALLLRSGALPAPLNIIEERTVGPDLGQDSINSGILALVIGFFLVIFFMLYKYKIFGLIANVALIANLFLLVGILTLFEATLTLPGIAGIILTVGMAVDANVLIFERIKEEVKVEKNNIIAFDSGYNRSKTAVIDANVTTLISAIILFFLGSGPIKGFSITLGVGIFTTLFSVYFIARLLTALYVVKNKNKESFNIMEINQINFNKYSKTFNIFSISLVIFSIILLLFKGLNYGVDFKGGTLIELRATDKQITISQLRQSFLNMDLGDISVKEFGKNNDFLIKFEKKDNDKCKFYWRN